MKQVFKIIFFTPLIVALGLVLVCLIVVVELKEIFIDEWPFTRVTTIIFWGCYFVYVGFYLFG